jgi:hypothetical protein
LRRLFLLVGAILAAGAGNAYAAGETAPPLVPRELASLADESHALVQVERGRAAEAAPRLRAAGGTVVSARLRIWRLPSRAAAAVVPALAVEGLLSDFEPDRPRYRTDHLDAGDPLLPEQRWWLTRVGADRVEPPGPGVPITIVDSGVDLSHPEFAGRPDTAALNEQTVTGEDAYHGTAVASVAAAPANGVGIVGIYPRALLRLWDASPAGRITTAGVISGIDNAPCRGVINLSFGGHIRSRLEAQAVVRAYERGCIVVAASGNKREVGNLPSFPASLPHVLTVGATDQTDRVAWFSSSSPGMDLVAPGVGIHAAVPLSRPESGYAQLPGTSFSAPMVAAATAWVWTMRPQLDKTQVFELMRRSARDLPPAGRNQDTGFGMLDIPTALTLPAPPIDPFEPNDTIAQVMPGRMFAAGKPPLTRPARGSATVNARLDVTDDPTDFYRVWAPRAHRTVVTLTGPASVQLGFAGPTVIRRTSRLAPRRLEITNRTAAGAFVYVRAFIRPNAQPTTATYRLRITTGRAPAPARR